MPIPKTELNKRKRAERKAQGLVEFRCWATPKDCAILKTHLDLMQKRTGAKK